MLPMRHATSMPSTSASISVAAARADVLGERQRAPRRPGPAGWMIVLQVRVVEVERVRA